MTEDTILLIGTPIGLFGVGYLAQRFAKARNTAGMLGLAAVWAIFTVFMYSGAVASSTVNWGAYVAALMFVSLPAAASFLVGGVVGWFRGR